MKVLMCDDDGNEVDVELPGKFRLTFKTPGVLYHALQYGEITVPEGFKEGAEEEYDERLEKWLEFKELLTVEFDVENMTATVVER